MTDQPTTLVEATGIGNRPASPEAGGLHRRLGQRQLTMMAIGGAIGVGYPEKHLGLLVNEDDRAVLRRIEFVVV